MAPIRVTSTICAGASRAPMPITRIRGTGARRRDSWVGMGRISRGTGSVGITSVGVGAMSARLRNGSIGAGTGPATGSGRSRVVVAETRTIPGRRLASHTGDRLLFRHHIQNAAKHSSRRRGLSRSRADQVRTAGKPADAVTLLRRGGYGGGTEMSVGQSVEKVCVCGRPTYGATECRYCAAVARAQHVDRMTVWPDTLCSSDTDETESPEPNTPPVRPAVSQASRTESGAVEQPIDAKTRIAEIRRTIATKEHIT